jgi:hypothetical protein
MANRFMMFPDATGGFLDKGLDLLGVGGGGGGSKTPPGVMPRGTTRLPAVRTQQLHKTADPYAGQRGQTGQGETQAPTGWDMTGAGVGEQYWDQNQGRFGPGGEGSDFWQQNKGAFGSPGQGEQFWNQAMGAWNQRLQQPKTNRAEEAYQQIQGQMPDLATDPGLDPYYQRAMQETERRMNRQAMATGQLGSSVANASMGNAMSGLAAERANREAEYNLARSADSRNWQGLGLSAAQGADQTGLAGQNADLGWVTGMGGLGLSTQGAGLGRTVAGMESGMNLDQLDLARLQAGMSGAMGAQDLRRTRGRDYMSDLQAMAGMSLPMVANTYGGMLDADDAWMQSMLGTSLGGGREMLNQDYRKSEGILGGVGAAGDMFGNIMGGFGGG